MTDVDDIITAAGRGELSIVTALLDEDPSLANATNARGDTPLIAAIYAQSGDVVRVLLDRGAAANLFECAALGETALVAAMLKATPSLVNTYSYDGWTALHLAAHFGQTETARTLLDAGADMLARSRNPLENMPLHAAVAGGERVDLARLLLERGAEVNATQHGGFTALHATAQSGYLEATRLLLAFGADASIRSDDGKTARQLAEEQGHHQVAALL